MYFGPQEKVTVTADITDFPQINESNLKNVPVRIISYRAKESINDLFKEMALPYTVNDTPLIGVVCGEQGSKYVVSLMNTYIGMLDENEIEFVNYHLEITQFINMKYYKFDIDEESWAYDYVIEFNVMSHKSSYNELMEIIDYFDNEYYSDNHKFYYPEISTMKSIIDVEFCPNFFIILMKNIEDVNMLLINLVNKDIEYKVYKINKERIT